MAWHIITMDRYVRRISGTSLDGHSPGFVGNILGVSRQRVHQLIANDKLDAYRIQDAPGELRAIVVTDESLARLCQERGIKRASAVLKAS